mmetsp:Transcript_20949/g.31937  ORF Transcript_20949/g.31937 Transcript_20949/m.31937 type:complete len:262 (-) Transcript_20949:80-865(-)
MTTTTPPAGHPAPTNTGDPLPELPHHQRKHIQIQHIEGIQTQTWNYKAVISNKSDTKMTMTETINCIGYEQHDRYADGIQLVNVANNEMVYGDGLTDLQHPSHYYTNINTNRTSSTTTILLQLRTHYLDTYYNLRDPLRSIQIRFPNWITCRFDEYLGEPTTLVGTILNVPYKHVHRDLLSNAILPALPMPAASIKPILKVVSIEFTHTKDGHCSTTTVVGIYGTTSIAAEVTAPAGGSFNPTKVKQSVEVAKANTTACLT